MAGGQPQAYGQSGLARFGNMPQYQPTPYQPMIFQPPQMGPRQAMPAPAPQGGLLGGGTTSDAGGVGTGVAGVTGQGGIGTSGQVGNAVASGLAAGPIGVATSLLGMAINANQGLPSTQAAAVAAANPAGDAGGVSSGNEGPGIGAAGPGIGSSAAEGDGSVGQGGDGGGGGGGK